jgi:hypothetical protein
VDCFQLQLPDLNIEFNQRLFECLDASGGAVDGAVHFGEVRVERVAVGGAAGDLIYDLVSQIVADCIDSLKYARRLPVETEDLDLAIDTLCNRDDRFMEGGSRNGEFFLKTIEEI